MQLTAIVFSLIPPTGKTCQKKRANKLKNFLHAKNHRKTCHNSVFKKKFGYNRGVASMAVKAKLISDFYFEGTTRELF